jgi:flagellar hook-length control protein FliK
MDIAALLTPGAATPASGTPMAPSADSAAPAGAFSDLLNAALANPVQEGVEAAIPTVPATAVATPVAVAPSDKVVPAVEVPPVGSTVPAISPVKPDEIPAPVPTVATREPIAKAEPTAPAVDSQMPTEAPPDPPPTEPVVSRKDAKAEAPNAPATKQDRPEKETQTSADAPVRLTAETAVANFVTVNSMPGVERTQPNADAKPASNAPAVVAAPAQKLSLRGAKPVVASANTPIEPGLEKTDSGETFVDTEGDPTPVTAIMDSPVPQVVSMDDPKPASTPKVDAPAPKSGKAVSAKGPKLQSAPDLGVVPKVVDSTPAEPTVEAARTSEKGVARKARDQAQLVSPVSAGATPETKDPVETKSADVAVVLGGAAKEEAPASGGGDQSPHDQPAPQDNPAPVAASAARTAATEKPEAGSQRPEVDRHLVVRQVADRIENLVAARPRDGVTIHLEPRDLGSVTLVVKGLSSALDVQMSATDSRVRESLNNSRPELAQALAPRGIELREMRVASAPTNATGTASHDAGTNPDGRSRQQTPRSSMPSFANPNGRSTPSQARTRAPRSGRGVDLLV